MRKRLIESLEYLFGQIGADLGLPFDACRELTTRIGLEPQSPHTFGAYFDLVFALENDELDLARALLDEMKESRPKADTSVASIDDHPSTERDRYRRLLMTGMDYALSPDPELMGMYRKRLGAAFALLDAGFPETIMLK